MDPNASALATLIFALLAVVACLAAIAVTNEFQLLRLRIDWLQEALELRLKDAERRLERIERQPTRETTDYSLPLLTIPPGERGGAPEESGPATI